MENMFNKMVEITAEEMEKQQNEKVTGNKDSEPVNEPAKEEAETKEDVKLEPKEEINNEDKEDILNSLKGKKTDDKKEEEERQSLISKATGIMSNFLKHIKSLKFLSEVNSEAKKDGLPRKVVKNIKIKAIMQGIADTLHLGIDISAEMILCVAEFIKVVIEKIVNFCKDILTKLVNFLTLNCGTACS